MTDAQQISLPIRPRPVNTPVEIPLDVIFRQPSRLAVMKLQAQASGLNDDQLCAELNIQPAQWSRIMNGAAHFPTEKYHRFNQITCSHYVLLWDLWTNGFDPESIRPLRSDLERRLEESEARNQTLEHEMAIMQRYIRMASGRNG